MIKEREGITTKEFLPKAKKYLATISKEEFMSDLKEQADIEKHHEQASPLPVPKQLEDRKELVKIISFHIEAIGATYGKDSLEPIKEVIADEILKAGYKKG